jgi:cell division protein FtsB
VLRREDYMEISEEVVKRLQKCIEDLEVENHKLKKENEELKDKVDFIEGMAKSLNVFNSKKEDV